MKKMRCNKKTFSVLIDKELLEKLENKLKLKNLTKKDWLELKIEEEIK